MHSNPYTLRTALSAFFLILSSVYSFAQTTENCTNGVDDDKDGLVDCFDPDCTCQQPCESFYYKACPADCRYVPSCDTIALGIQWVGESETNTYSTIVAGDMDRDGIPDIVTYRCEERELYIIDGRTGKTKVTINGPTNWAGGTAPAIADLDDDGFGEIVIVGGNRRLYCYEHTGALKFISLFAVGYDQRYKYAVPSIADVDNNGRPEIIIGNQVYSGQTGLLLASGGNNLSDGEHPARVALGFSFCSTVAIDALPDGFCPDCAGLEIVAGNQVLSVNLTNGQVRAVVTAPAPFTDGFTSVADFDRDGDLDAIVAGRKGGENHVYVWDIQTPTIMHEFKPAFNEPNGTSRVNVADLDGDGELEVSFVSFPKFYALDNDFSLMWIDDAKDPSSITSSSVFDFCGDGSAEVVYRDEDRLVIYDGSTGKKIWQDVCRSQTHIENPLILDVDADGQTEVVILCGQNGKADEGTVVVYEAIGAPNIASRPVWNQHAYFNTNIYDNLKVPRHQQNPHVVGDSLKLNSFLNQYFNPIFPASDGILSFKNIRCVKDSLDVSVEVCNTGDAVFPTITPVSFYQGNPQTTPAGWISTKLFGTTIKPDSCHLFTFRIPRVANDSVFVVLNDDHSLPTPYSLAKDFPVNFIGECNYKNNIGSFYFEYQPGTLELGKDTAICANTSIVLNAAGKSLSSWKWNDNSTQSTLSVSKPGNYAVTVTDACGSTQTDQISVGIDNSTIVQIGPDQAFCKGESVSLSESGFDYYKWTGENLDCANCASVKASPTTSGLIILEAGFNNGCVNRDTVAVTVFETYLRQIDTSICYGRTLPWGNVQIRPDSTRTFSLKTVQGCDSTVIVRVKGTKVGTYDIKIDTSVCLGKTLVVNNVAIDPGQEKIFNLNTFKGCDSTVLVRAMAKDTFFTRDSAVICFGKSVNIFGSPQSAPGLYRRTFKARNGCDSTAVFKLGVWPETMIEIDATPTCFAEATGELSANVTGFGPFTYTWSIPGETGKTLTDLAQGNYTVTITDARDCTASASQQLDAHPPIVFAVAADSVKCFGQKNGGLTLTSPDNTLIYSLNNGVYTTEKSFFGLPADEYTVLAQDVFGCIDTQKIVVGQPPQLVVQLPQDTTLFLGDSLAFNIVSDGLPPFRFQWSDTAYLSCGNCNTLRIQPFTDKKYTLTVTDAKGCQAFEQLAIKVQRLIEVYVPNVISTLPQNDYNSRLTTGFGQAVKKVKLMQIYDRWGTLLYSKQNLLPNDDTVVWDGKYQGDFVNPGVYIWLLELELIDGTIEKYSGDVTVVR